MKKIIRIAVPDLKLPLTAELLGKAIKARRTQSNLRLEDAAALCGVAKQTLMNIEHGKKGSQLGSILQVCSALGIKLSILPWHEDEEVNNDWQ